MPQSDRIGLAFDLGRKLQVMVQDVDGDHPVGLEPAAIDGERLVRQEMDRNRIARKGVEDEDVVRLVLLALQHEAGIAVDDFDRSPAVGQKREPVGTRRGSRPD